MSPSPPADALAGREGPADPIPVDDSLLRRWRLPVDPEGGKESRGTVMVVAGSPSTPGAALLAGLAALRSGAGRVQLVTDPAVAVALGVALPEARVDPWRVRVSGGFSLDEAIAERAARADTVLVGPGMVDDDSCAEVVGHLLMAVSPDAVVVLDAMAIGVVRELDPSIVDRVNGRLVLSPNVAELDRLEGSAAEPARDLIDRVRDAAVRFGAAVTVHGCTAATDGRCWSDAAGGPGLGTSGSGDVLAGLIAGVAARSHDPAQAAVWGAHLHAAAGDVLAARSGPVGFLARELVDAVPSVLGHLEELDLSRR